MVRSGPSGERGERGPVLQVAAGRRWQGRAVGTPGANGRDGSPGISVETAIVNTKGHLLIGLSDGDVIDAGAVIGPVGATGEPGAAGLPGRAGADGAAVLSGPRTPQQTDGNEGDHWIDISSAEFNFYKKSGNGWSMLASLRQPGKNPAVAIPVGGGSGAGSGGPAGGYTTSNLPMTGLGREAKDDDGLANPPPGGINKPGGNIIPEARRLRYHANYNSWAVESLDALDEALPVSKVDDLPDEGKVRRRHGVVQRRSVAVSRPQLD